MRPTRFLPKAYSVDRFKVHPAFLPLPANLCHPGISAEGLLGSCRSPTRLYFGAIGCHAAV
ncbi:MAG: hypothetical protein Q8M58_01080, partial [Anaerolineales bacterium]|nr:hypothetical protein [Anaerolineales bacterium]